MKYTSSFSCGTCGPSVGFAANLTSRSPSTNTSADRPGVLGSARAAASETGAGVRSMTGSPIGSAPGRAGLRLTLCRSTVAAMMLTLPDLAATERFAAEIAAKVRPGDAILLSGPLGAGKTAFARALLRAATGDPALDVPSPSFTLVQTYDTRRGPVHHYDLWRIDRADDLAELGLEEAVRDIALIEWPERLGETPPEA